jgi:hypothetical protein
MSLFFENKKYCKDYENKSYQIIPFEFFSQIPHREECKNSECNNFLNSFKLNSVVAVVPYSVSRHLKTIFKKRNPPTCKNYNNQRQTPESEMTVPRKSHKNI